MASKGYDIKHSKVPQHPPSNPEEQDNSSSLYARNFVKQAIQSQMPAETKSPLTQSGNEQDPPDLEADPVHPQISKIRLFEEKATLNDNVYTHSSDSGLNKLQTEGKINFGDLLDKSKSGRLVILVGAAGSGKTTSSIRLAKKFNEDSNKLCFRLEFRELDHEKKLTLQELLLNPLDLTEIIKADSKLGSAERRKDKKQRIDDVKHDVYTWSEENCDHILLIIDGYDQFPPGIKRIPPRRNAKDKMDVADLVASLCKGFFFGKSQVILTSRSHALSSLPKTIKLKATTFLLQDLSENDMMTLLKQLAGNEYDKVLDALETKAPHLKAVCHNPLLLRMYVAAALSGDPADITSMTRIFNTVLSTLRITEHFQGDYSSKLDEDSLRSLCGVAYEAIDGKSVLISEELLTKHGLDVEKVQGFIFMVPGSKKAEKLFDGGHQLFFSHQTLQEYFAARYIWKYMTDDKIDDKTEDKAFDTFIKENLCKEYWFVVAQFLCGMIVDTKANDDKAAERNRSVVITLVNEMDRIGKQFDSSVVVGNLPNICSMVRECQDKDAVAEVAKSLPTSFLVEFQTLSEGHALGYVVKACGHRIDELDLTGEPGSLGCFLNEVKDMKETIGTLKLKNILFHRVSDDCWKAVIAALPKIKNELELTFWSAKHSEDYILEWINKLQRSRNALDADKGPEIVLTEYDNNLKNQNDLNYHELVKKLRQRGHKVEFVNLTMRMTMTRTYTSL